MKLLVTLLTILALTAPGRADQLTLDDVMAEAHATHPRLRASQALADAARVQARQDGAWANPGLFLRLEAAPRHGDAWNDAGRIVGLSQSLPLAGRPGAARAMGEAAAAMAAGEVSVRSNELAAAIRRDYAEAWHAQQSLAMREAARDAAADLLDLVQQRVTAGDAARMELLRARMVAGEANAELAAARARHTAALAALGAWLGRPVTAGTVIMPVPALIDGAVDGSARLAVATAQVEVAAARVGMAGRSRWPELELEAGLRTSPEGDAFDAGLRLSLPLWDRGSARVQAARARQQADEHRLVAERRDIVAALGTARSRLQAAREALQIHTQEVVPDAEAAVTAVRAAYAAGDVDLGEVLQVMQAWIGARLSRLDWAREAVRAEAALVALK